MLFLDGVYVGEAGSSARFRWVIAPTTAELTQPTHTIAHRLARYLDRQGLLERDAEHSLLALECSDEDSMDQLRGHSMMCMDARMPRAHGCAGAATYRIAVGRQQGRKVFTLQTLPDELDADGVPTAGNVAGLLRQEGSDKKQPWRHASSSLQRSEIRLSTVGVKYALYIVFFLRRY